MTKLLLKGVAIGAMLSVGACATPQVATYTMNSNFLSLPEGMEHVGDSHGDIAIAPDGEIFISIKGGDRPGLQVYSADGRYLRNIDNAPEDFHGFIISAGAGRQASLYGARLIKGDIVQMSLDGEVLLTIPASAIPDEYKTEAEDQRVVKLTGIAVAPNGDIYVTDGYGRDFIHRFDKSGKYISTFGGREPPYSFDTCHKIAIDPRFEPARLLCADRRNSRLVHMALDGEFLGVFASDLKYPSALAVHGNHLAVADLDGQVVILDKDAHHVRDIGVNLNSDQVRSNRIPPTDWRDGLFYSPHGITFDPAGNLYVAEWSKWGRVTKITRN